MQDNQIRGLNWLISLFTKGKNQILAEETGLKKKTLLGYLKNYYKLEESHFLVIGIRRRSLPLPAIFCVTFVYFQPLKLSSFKANSDDGLKCLHNELKYFLLRRLKSEVEISLLLLL
jgi:SNF2 family DNA or RNA helicase